jgi:hypothetical protein
LRLQWNNKSSYEIYIPCSLYQVGLLTLLNAHWFSTRFLSCEIFYDWLISMGWDYVSELLSLQDILFAPQMIWVWRATMELYWQGETEELGEKPVPVPATLSTTNPTWIDPGANPGLPGERLTAWRMAQPNLLWKWHTNLYQLQFAAQKIKCLFPLLCVNMLWPDLWTVQQCFSRTN